MSDYETEDNDDISCKLVEQVEGAYPVKLSHKTQVLKRC